MLYDFKDFGELCLFTHDPYCSFIVFVEYQVIVILKRVVLGIIYVEVVRVSYQIRIEYRWGETDKINILVICLFGFFLVSTFSL